MNFIKYLDTILIVIGIAIIITFTFLGNFIYIDSNFSPSVLSNYGNFIGGTVGLLFSLAGYLIISKTFILQKKQSFATLFFSTVKEFNDFRTSKIALFSLNNDQNANKELHSGYHFFDTFFSEYFQFSSQNQTTTIKKVQNAFKENRYQISRYIGHLNMIVYQTEISSLNEFEKKFYIKYLTNLLSEQELFIIANYKQHIDHKNFDYLDYFEFEDKERFKNIVL